MIVTQGNPVCIDHDDEVGLTYERAVDSFDSNQMDLARVSARDLPDDVSFGVRYLCDA